MFDPTSEDGRRRLCAARDASWEVQKTYRAQRINFIQEFIGSGWKRESLTETGRILNNEFRLVLQSYIRILAGKAPRATVSTFHTSLKPEAIKLALALNQLIKQISLAKTFRQIVTDSMFGLGIMRMGICDYEEGEDNVQVKPGQVFAERISQDCWVHDMGVSDLRLATFMGHKYRMRADDLRDAEAFDKTVRHEIASRGSNYYEKESTARNIGTPDGQIADENQITDYVCLWDLWLPREKKLITLADRDDVKPLRVLDWTGPNDGPYRVLALDMPPDNTMPVPPAAVFYHHWKVIKGLTDKLADQAERQKTIGVCSAQNVEDAKALMAAQDGHVVPHTGPADAIKELKLGGPVQENFMLLMNFMSSLNRTGGNIDSLAGLGAQTETFKQDQLIASSASQTMDDVRTQVEEFYRGVVGDLAFHLMADPGIELPLTYRLPGVGVDLDFTWTAAQQAGEYLSYNYDIELGSAQPQSPSQKYAGIMEMLAQLAPFSPMMQQQGVQINFGELIRLSAELRSSPEIRDVFQIASPMYEMPPHGDIPAKNPNKPNGQYTRTNKSGGGADSMMQMAGQAMSASRGMGGQPA